MLKRYQALYEEVRTYCPDDAQWGTCKDPRQQAAFEQVRQQLDKMAETHPEYTAMKMRKEYYRIMDRNFHPMLFRNAPFFFSVGINGGWCSNPSHWFWGRFTEKILSSNVPETERNFFRERMSKQHFFLCCGPFVDMTHHLPPLTKLLKRGLRGVWEDVQAERKKADLTDPEREFLEISAAGLETMHSMQLKFREEALRILKEEPLTDEQKKFMRMAADSAERVPWEPPGTFFEGLNMFLFVREIMSLLDSLMIFSLGHPDAMLYPLYQADLKAGRITAEEAYDLLCRFMVICDAHYDGWQEVRGYNEHELEQPLTIGGCDETGTPVFNDLTRFILRGHRENDLVFPKLHCRIRADSPSEYYDELAKDIFNSRCVHTLFNDDVIIPGLMKQGKTREEACRYICAGCWNGYVDSVENVDDANYYSLARVLEAMIYQDPGQNERLGYVFETLDDCASFEDMRDRICRNITGFLRTMLDAYAKYGRLFSQISPHPVYSACLDGCITNRKDETQGGARFSGRVIVLAFLANVVDSILSVKHVCFDKKICSVPSFLNAVRNNWKNAENLRHEAMKAHYWGDGSAESMGLGKWLLEKIRRSADGLKNERGGVFYFSIWIYREFRFWGEMMRALPDGRHDGDFLSQALNPSEFRNREEITTTLNALACLDYTDFASSNINLTFDRENVSPEILKAIFQSFVEKNCSFFSRTVFPAENWKMQWPIPKSTTISS